MLIIIYFNHILLSVIIYFVGYSYGWLLIVWNMFDIQRVMLILMMLMLPKMMVMTMMIIMMTLSIMMMTIKIVMMMFKIVIMMIFIIMKLIMVILVLMMITLIIFDDDNGVDYHDSDDDKRDDDNKILMIMIIFVGDYIILTPTLKAQSLIGNENTIHFGKLSELQSYSRYIPSIVFVCVKNLFPSWTTGPRTPSTTCTTQTPPR